ncbi:MAG: DUF3185 family protein [Planctomycetota bacterium]|nr:DUF3185 family protein [Planctomycetota bacterium]
MSPQRMLGIVLLVIGIGVLIMGMNATHSIADQTTNTFTGHFTDHTTLYIIAGIALGIVGFVMALFNPGGKGV